MKNKTFEEALKELEMITRELENGEIDLDNSIKKYEEANKLMNFCSEKLSKAHESVTKIISEDEKEVKFEGQ